MQDGRSTPEPTSDALPDTEPRDHAWLLEKLGDTIDQLRTMKVAGDRQKLQLAQAAWRIEGAASAIRNLQAQYEALQARSLRADPREWIEPAEAEVARVRSAGGCHQAMAQIRWRHS